jgi:hypothetical protein
VDLWVILLAVWLPIAGIVIALCFYAMTADETDGIAAEKAGFRRPRGSGAKDSSPDQT